MKELSLNILDIVGNSIKAKASLIEIFLTEQGNTLTIEINDNGCGMDGDTLSKISNPFYTTRTTRKVGMGIPFFILAAEQTGGNVSITSVPRSKDGQNCGTRVKALFYTDNIDFTPLGDIVSTVTTLIHGSPDIDFHFMHIINDKTIELDTRDIRAVLGDDVPLNSIEVIEWIKNELTAEYKTN